MWHNALDFLSFLSLTFIVDMDSELCNSFTSLGDKCSDSSTLLCWVHWEQRHIFEVISWSQGVWIWPSSFSSKKSQWAGVGPKWRLWACGFLQLSFDLWFLSLLFFNYNWNPVESDLWLIKLKTVKLYCKARKLWLNQFYIFSQYWKKIYFMLWILRDGHII